MKIESEFVGAMEPAFKMNAVSRATGLAAAVLARPPRLATRKGFCPPTAPRKIIPLVTARCWPAIELRRELARGQVWEAASYIALGACFLALVAISVWS